MVLAPEALVVDLPCEAPSDMQSGEGKPLGTAAKTKRSASSSSFSQPHSLVEADQETPICPQRGQ